MPSGTLAAFLGALQASVSVLLTIFYGVVVAQFDFIDGTVARRVSILCIHLFLPCLLIINIGSQLDAESAPRYAPIVLWSFIYNTVSMTMGLSLQKCFHMPSWLTPAVTFNNSISMPVLLTAALETTGCLDSLLRNADDTTAAAVIRAKSYFLINAVVCDCLTFGLGHRLLVYSRAKLHPEIGEQKFDPAAEPLLEGSVPDVERAESICESIMTEAELDAAELEENERTSLLPRRIIRAQTKATQISRKEAERYWQMLPIWIREILDFVHDLVSPPMIGAAIGATIGLVPVLKKAFFSNDGIFKAWLTVSIKNLGELFTVLQILVVGVKLKQSLLCLKRGEDSGHVPLGSMITITFIRFVMWPLMSIPLIFFLATKTSWLDKDPILWFAMMIMPVGPPALKLASLADMSGAKEQEKMSIAKFLTMSYAVSPLISFGVVGALKACQAAVA